MKRNRALEIDAVVDAIYDAALDPARWADALAGISRLVDARITSLHEHDYRNASSRLIAASAPIPGDDLAAHEHYSPLNPFMPAAEGALRTGSVLFSGAFVPDRELFKTAYYNEYMNRITGFHHNVGICLERTATLAAMVYPMRAIGQPAFTAGDLETCARLVPHLQRARTVNRRLEQASFERLATAETLERLQTALCIVDGRGTVRFANAQAIGVLDERDGLHIRDGRLAALQSSETGRLQRLLAEACGAVDAPTGGAMRIPRASGRRAYDVIVTPIGRDRMPLPGHAVALVLISDPERSASDAGDLLAALYGLTPTEARVALLLLAGARADEIADRLQVTGNTVRTHIKRALGKLDVRTQSDLVRVLMSGPARVRSVPSERSAAKKP